MKIEELLKKYFEGETTCAEEQELRHFFSTENVPEHLNCYRPLFLCLETECRKQNEIRSEKNVPKQNHQEPTKPDSIRRNHRRQLYIWGAGIAASLLLFVLFHPEDRKISHDNKQESYVLIDGKRYEDPELIRDKALEALMLVKIDEKELRAQLIPDL